MNKTLNIKFDDELLGYLSKKGKNILTLTVKSSGGGCCPTIEVAEVDMIEPADTSLYDVFTHENITLYISKNTRVTAPVLKFKLEKNFMFYNIVPIGLSLKQH